MPPAARLGDQYTCRAKHRGGTIAGNVVTNVLIEGSPAAVVGSVGSCGCTICSGSSTVFIGGKPAARIGDADTHGGNIVSGACIVIIGG